MKRNPSPEARIFRLAAAMAIGPDQAGCVASSCDEARFPTPFQE